MPNKDMTLWKAPGRQGPTTEQFEAIAKKYPAYFGVGMALDGDLEPDTALPKVSAMVKTASTFKDIGLVFHFGNYPPPYNVEDKQPFVVLKDGNKNIVLAFISGQFPSYIDEKSGHSPEYNVAVDLIMPLLAELWKDAEKNLAKFKKKMDDPAFRKQFNKRGVGNCNITLMFSDGDIINPIEGFIKTSYGWTTDECKTVAETAPAPAPAEPEPAKPKIGIQDEEVEEPEETPVDATGEVEEVEEPNEVETTTAELAKKLEAENNGKTDTAISSQLNKIPLDCKILKGSDGLELWYTPPAQLHGNGLKNGYKRGAGWLSDGKAADAYGNIYPHWKHERPSVRVQPNRMKGLNLALLMDTKGAVELAPVTKKSESTKPPEAVGFMLTPEAISKIDANLKQPKVRAILDEYERKVITPEDLENQTKKLPDFGKSNGLDVVVDTARWTIDLAEQIIPDKHSAVVWGASWKLQALKWAPKDVLDKINATASKHTAAGDKNVQPDTRRAKGIVNA